MNPKDNKTNRNNFIRGVKSINLIPPLTQEQVVVVQTKSTLNLGAAISLFVLIALTLLIVGFNIFAKLELNTKKDKLYKIENTLKQRETLLSSNDEILRRALLYKKIESTTFSTKDLIVYLQTISKGMGTIESMELIDGSNFVITGGANTLTDVSKLWYVLGNDKFVESVNLKNVVKDPTGARFNFEGKLRFEEFKKAQATNNG